MKIDAAASPYACGTAQNAKENDAKEAEYKRFLDCLRSCTETEAQRKRRMAAEEKEARIRREKNRKMLLLDSRIAFLRSRIMTDPEDNTARGEMAMAKCQRFWVSNSL